jgi:hypothetical protein
MLISVCVQSRSVAAFVMLNLFQHLVVLMGYETLKQVQGDIPVIYTQTLFSVCVQSRSVAAFVMLNLFQHLVVSMGYETLKQVQGDIPVIYTQTLIIRDSLNLCA